MHLCKVSQKFQLQLHPVMVDYMMFKVFLFTLLLLLCFCHRWEMVPEAYHIRVCLSVSECMSVWVCASRKTLWMPYLTTQWKGFLPNFGESNFVQRNLDGYTHRLKVIFLASAEAESGRMCNFHIRPNPNVSQIYLSQLRPKPNFGLCPHQRSQYYTW